MHEHRIGVIRVVLSSGRVIEPSDDLVEEFGSVGLAAFLGWSRCRVRGGQELRGHDRTLTGIETPARYDTKITVY
jgi:hypothetical protein